MPQIDSVEARTRPTLRILADHNLVVIPKKGPICSRRVAKVAGVAGPSVLKIAKSCSPSGLGFKGLFFSKSKLVTATYATFATRADGDAP